MFKYLFVGALLLIKFSACIEAGNTFTKMPPGPWRGVLKLDKVNSRADVPTEEDILAGKLAFDAVNPGELPFNFEVVYTDKDNFHILLKNADEVFKITDITWGLDRRTAKDTFTFSFPFYNAAMRGIFEENIIEGEWILYDREDYKIPFVAYHGKNFRFTELKKEPLTDLGGTWKLTMGTDTENPYEALGEFNTKGNYISGSILEETGDYRYLEGTVQGDKMYLSQFDGATAYLIEAKLMEDGTLQGFFRSGKHFQTTWTGQRTNENILRNPGEIVNATGVPFDFRFSDSKGHIISLDDPEFAGKAKIIQILGTWCHNCYDETRFLVEQAEKYKNRDIAIIGLAFERSKDTLSAMKRLEAYQDRLNVQYPILLAALTTNKAEALKYLPALDQVFAFPTTIFLDKNNNIYKIHAGFYGPATSKYKYWVEEFEETVQKLIE